MAHSGDEYEGEEGEAGSASLTADGGIAEASLVSSRGPTIGGGECEVGMVVDVYWRADDTVFRGTVDMVEDGQVLVHYPSTRRLIWHDGQDGCSFTLVEAEAVRAAAAAEQVDCSIHPLPHPPTNEPTHSQSPPTPPPPSLSTLHHRPHLGTGQGGSREHRGRGGRGGRMGRRGGRDGA